MLAQIPSVTEFIVCAPYFPDPKNPELQNSSGSKVQIRVVSVSKRFHTNNIIALIRAFVFLVVRHVQPVGWYF